MDKEFNVREFYIAITNRCNLACIMCTTGSGRHNVKDELTAEEWKVLISNLSKDCLIQRVTFGGGEPLLRKDLSEIVKFALSAGSEEVNIISNGTLLNRGFMQQFDEGQLSRLGINISIDGLEYDHDYIRGHGVFKRMIRNFEFLYYDFFKPGRIKDLVVSSVLMQENFAHYIDFLDFIKRYGGVRVDIQPVIPNNEICYQKGDFRLSEKEKNKLAEIIDYLLQNINISARPPELIRAYSRYFENNLEKSNRCSTGYESLNITFDGYPYLCGKQIMMPLHKVGFKDVFYSRQYQDELERIKSCRQPCLQGLHLNPDEGYGQAEGL
ncbi:MAG: radical SAM protein [Candidatus Omnitrophica bacterium]|nr:radical SAM protein [Candidatus Omnitrophota bacterium]